MTKVTAHIGKQIWTLKVARRCYYKRYELVSTAGKVFTFDGHWLRAKATTFARRVKNGAALMAACEATDLTTD